jgi:hypothetical protein
MTTVPCGGRWPTSRPCRFTPTERPLHPGTNLDRRLGGHQGLSGSCVEDKNLTLPGFEPWTASPEPFAVSLSYRDPWIFFNCLSSSSSCGRQSVDQFVWVSGHPLGPLTRFYLALLSSSDNYFILLSKVPALTRKRVCNLQCNHSLVRLLTPNNHTLPSHLRLCSLFVAS